MMKTLVVRLLCFMLVIVRFAANMQAASAPEGAKKSALSAKEDTFSWQKKWDEIVSAALLN